MSEPEYGNIESGPAQLMMVRIDITTYNVISIQSGARVLSYLVNMMLRMKLTIDIREPVMALLTKYCATIKASDAVWKIIRGRFFLSCMLTTVQMSARMPKACPRNNVQNELSMARL